MRAAGNTGANESMGHFGQWDFKAVTVSLVCLALGMLRVAGPKAPEARFFFGGRVNVYPYVPENPMYRNDFIGWGPQISIT